MVSWLEEAMLCQKRYIRTAKNKADIDNAISHLCHAREITVATIEMQWIHTYTYIHIFAVSNGSNLNDKLSDEEFVF